MTKLWRLTKFVFFEKDLGPFSLTIASQFDSALVERYIFPTLRYATNLHHQGHGGNDGITFFTSIQFCWWAWYVSIRKRHQPQPPESTERQSSEWEWLGDLDDPDW